MSSFKESRWRVLPVGPAATLLRSTREAMFSCLVGLGGLSLVIFLGGLVTEEVAAGSAAGAALDLVSRASLGSSAVIGSLGLFAVAGAGTGLGGALWSVSLQAGLSDGNIYTAADPQLRAAAALGPWIVLASLAVMALGIVLVSLLDARDRGLRDELVQRWPVRAEQPVLSVLAEVVLEKKGGASS